MVKQLVAAFLCVFAAVGGSVPPEESVTGARAAILIERETGQVLYEHNADERLPIASVTKPLTPALPSTVVIITFTPSISNALS